MRLRLKQIIFILGRIRLIINRPRQLFILAALIVGSFILSHLCFWLLPNVFKVLNYHTIDQLFVFRHSTGQFCPDYDNTVVHVDLNNATIEKLGHHYVDRSDFGKLVDNLAGMDVAAQMMDFIFAAKTRPDEDSALIEATEAAGNVYFGVALRLDGPGAGTVDQASGPEIAGYLDHFKWNIDVKGDDKALYQGKAAIPTFKELGSVARGLGSLSVKFDPDGVLRRVPLIVQFRDGYYPLLPFRVICNYLGVGPENILLKPGRHIVLKNAARPGEGGAPHDIVIPIDRHGNLIINFLGPWGAMDHYNFSDVLLASGDRDLFDLWQAELAGKIVVISDLTTGSTDTGSVPTDRNFPLSGIHSNLINTILTESFIKEYAAHQMLFIEFLLMAGLLFMAMRFGSIAFSVGSVMLAGFYLLVAAGLFLYAQTIVNIILPLLILLFSIISVLIYQYIQEEKAKLHSARQRDFIRNTFGRYLSNEVVDQILGSPQGLDMNGEIRKVTTLVTDLRGFTALTAKLSPRVLIDMLNRYFERMVDIITAYNGTVNGFEGDGILVFFGAPLSSPDDPERAVACAIAMQNAMNDFNADQRRREMPELSMGIGINTGDVVVGNIGSEKRSSYTAIGTAINMAYRIETFTVGGQILVSPSTYANVESRVTLRGTKNVQFKGVDHAITLYDIAALSGDYQIELSDQKPDIRHEIEPIPVSCFSMTQKTVSESSISGCITRIGESSAEIEFDCPVAAYTNLIVRVNLNASADLPDIYAKVLPAEEPAASALKNAAILNFTWLPESAKQYFCQAAGI